MPVETQTIRSIFLAAVENHTPDQWPAFLEEVCKGNANQRREVENLLQAHVESNSLLDNPESKLEATISQLPRERPGTVIGRYKLLEQVGEGGMGVVYVAEQTEPVRRRVALKIIKPGMDTKQVIARFEAERQALAMMDHPNIARVLDAGTTEAARPYFVMELVRGMPITDYCDKARLSPRQRLELFVDVCQAVQHAHQKGIIHRDLKPSNVMVTTNDGRPVVKVIDFGVAKAVGQQLTERTVYTALTQLVGTPLYMSPEQAELTSNDVDTRSDVYSLGVVLYELLTGQTPFDKETLSKAGLDEMRRIIREDEPLRPSRRFSTLGAQAISTVSQHRSLDERRLSKILCGELDWIIMKSLEKDRSRRYESASALAADIQRYLSDEPVLACSPTTMYRFQKFARKHKPALATAAAIALCLLLGTSVSAWQAVRATTAETQATANERKAVENEQKANANAAEAQLKEQEATKERDEVKSLNGKLAAKEQQLQRTLYAANMKLAKVAWDEAAIHQVQELLDEHRPKPGELDLRGFEWRYLDRLCHSELLTLKGKGAAFSPDGKLLARIVENGVVVLRNLQSGKDVFTLKRGDRPVFSPDGRRLASGGSDVKVWDVQTGKELFSVPGAGRIMRAVVFSPDGKWLAAGTSGWDNKMDVAAEVKVWDASNGQELFTSKGHAVGGGVWSLAFSPDGQRLASGSADKTVKIWDAMTGQELLSLKGHNDSVDHVAFTPDASRLVSVADDRTVKIWDVQTGKELIALQGSNSRLALSPDGRRLATAANGGQVKIWDAQTGEELHSLQHASYSLTFSPDSKRLASGSGDRTVKLWDAETGQELCTYKGHPNIVTDVLFDPSGTRLASTSIDGTVKVWDATTSPGVRTMSDIAGTARKPVFSPDGQRLAGIERNPNSQNYAVKVWNVQTGQVVRILNGKPRENLLCLAASRDGKRFITGTGQWDNAKKDYVGGDVKIWDAQTGRELLTFKAYETAVNKLSISPDGTRLATGDFVARAWSKGGEVKLWDALTGQQLLALTGHTASINDLAFSPDGKRLATHSLDNTVKVWDVETGQVILTITSALLLPDYGSISFSPDGKRLAGSGRASSSGVGPAAIGEIKVWDAQTGDELLTLKGHTLGISSVVYSPDGKRLASASGGAAQGPGAGEVKVWDAETGRDLLTLKGGVFGHRIAFSPDSTLLASDAGGTVKIYDATPLPEKP